MTADPDDRGAPADLDGWRLEVTDILGTRRSSRYTTLSVSLSYAELSELGPVTVDARLTSRSGGTAHHRWEGYRLADVLEILGRTDGGDLYLRQRSIDLAGQGCFESTIPLADALAREAILVTCIDGEPLTPAQGYPVRLVDFGLYSYKCMKALGSLAVTTDYRHSKTEQFAGHPLDGTVHTQASWVYEHEAAQPLAAQRGLHER
jgi:DMSO/TMAO reductase YedYZ molybdopterin-dependent catalytic subunit